MVRCCRLILCTFTNSSDSVYKILNENVHYLYLFVQKKKICEELTQIRD